MSDWLDILRAACEASSQKVVAAQVGYTQAVVSAVLCGTYTGSLDRVQAAVEGALMRAEVDCPVIGLIPRQRCVEHQRRPFTPTNPMAVQLYRACRSGCPHAFAKPTCATTPSVQPAVTNNTGIRGAATPADVPSAISGGVTRTTDRRKRSTPHTGAAS